jgi:hypothetical protein
MTGWHEYQAILKLRDDAEKLGFEIHGSKYGNGNTLSLRTPADPSSYATLPIYSRDVTIFEGTAEALMLFMQGYRAHCQYMGALGLGKSIRRAEDKHAGKVIARKMGMIKDEKAQDDVPF